MIIEFNGLPGTGKTTVAGEVEALLEKRNIKPVFRYQRKENRIKSYLSYIFDGSLRLYGLARKYTNSIPGGNRAERLKTASVLVYYYRMYRHFTKDCPNQVLLIDQGLLQGLISIPHTDCIADRNSLDRILRFLAKRKTDVCLVHCKTDVELSFKRMRQRNTTAGRLDRCGDEELLKNLKIQEHNFEIVRDAAEGSLSCKQVEIDTQFPPDENALKILNTFLEVDG